MDVPEAVVEAVLDHSWVVDRPRTARNKHSYYEETCAVCQEDVAPILAVAAPHIAAAALRLAAEELRDRMDSERLSVIYHAWLLHRADVLDGHQPEPDTREGILAAAGLTEADMQERTGG